MPHQFTVKGAEPGAAAQWAAAWARELRAKAWIARRHQPLTEKVAARCVERLLQALTAAAFAPGPAREAAHALVAAQYTAAETLPVSLRVYRDHAAAAAPAADTERLAAVEDAFITGYIGARVAAVAAAQETAYRATALTIDRAERQVREVLQVQHAVFEQVPSPLCLADARGTPVRVNDAFTELTGRDATVWSAVKINEFMPPEDAAAVWTAFRAVADGQVPTTRRQASYRHRDGRLIPAEITVTRLPRTERTPGYVLLHAANLSDHMLMRNLLTREVYQDAATFLLNRLGFHARLTEICQDAAARPVVFYVRLTGLAGIDARGEYAGQQILLAVADQIQRSLGGRTDLVGRVERGTFAVAVAVAGRGDIRELAEGLHAAVRDGPRLAGYDVGLACVVGIAERGPATATADDLMAAADTAATRAEQPGAPRTVVHQPAARRTRGAALLDALADDSLTCAYEPVYGLRGHRLAGLLAHPRALAETDLPLTPRRFLAPAPGLGARDWARLRRRLFTAACTHTREHNARTGRRLFVGLPLTAGHPVDAALLPDIAAALTASGLPPHLLDVHLAQADLRRHGDSLAGPLHALAALGVRLTLSGLGPAPLDLPALCDLPWHGVTLHHNALPPARHGAAPGNDGNDGGDGPAGDRLAAAVVRVAELLGLATTADYVESPRQAADLRRLGCGLAWGPYARHAAPEHGGPPAR